MRKYWKTLILAAAATACAMLLGGCHGGVSTTSFAVPDTFDEDASHEITFWAKNDTNKAQTNIYEKAIRDFVVRSIISCSLPYSTEVSVYFLLK